VLEGQASWWIHREPARRHDCCPATRSTATSSSPPRDIGLPGLTLTRTVTGPNGVEVTGYPLAVLADHPASDNDKLIALAMLYAVVAAAAQAEASTMDMMRSARFRGPRRRTGRLSPRCGTEPRSTRRRPRPAGPPTDPPRPAARSRLTPPDPRYSPEAPPGDTAGWRCPSVSRSTPSGTSMRIPLMTTRSIACPFAPTPTCSGALHRGWFAPGVMQALGTNVGPHVRVNGPRPARMSRRASCPRRVDVQKRLS
jgi:hypothetical protein